MKLHNIVILHVSVLLVSGFRLPRYNYIDDGTSHRARTLGVCQTKTCRQTATRFLQNMDASVNPCDNFYKYACGNFIRHSTIRPDQTSNNSFLVVRDVMEEHIKTLISTTSKSEPPFATLVRHTFSLCMNENAMDRRGVFPLLTRLWAAGGWPVLGNWRAEGWSILRTETLLDSLIHEGNIFFVAGGTQDLKNNSHNLMGIVEPETLGLPSIILVRGEDDPQVKAYYSFMVDIAVIFGADRKIAEKDLKDVLLMELELAKLLTPPELKRDISRFYNIRTLKQLMMEVSWFRWDKLLQIKTKGLFSITGSDQVLIGNVEYLKNVGGLVRNYPKRVLANYMMIRTAMKLCDLLTSELRDRLTQLYAELSGTSQRRPRWKECLKAVQAKFPIAIAAMYVNRYFDKKSKKIAADMSKQIREEMRREILSIDWMDGVTRSKAVKKLDDMIEVVGYPDELMDPAQVLNFYEGLHPNKEHFFESLLDINGWQEDKNIKKFKTPANRSDWTTPYSNAAAVNAFYVPNANSIILPAGILQGLFFSVELPQYVNFASIGYIIGHEVTHGFDDQGSQFDSKGNLHNWWDDISKKNFDEKKQCFIDQYGKFRDDQTNLMLNGILTQGENIADNGGMKIAYKAYKTWVSQHNRLEPSLPGLEQFSTDQLFLLSSANLWCDKTTDAPLRLQIVSDTHSTAEFRINGVFMNLPQFGRIFKCRKNTKMNPPNKCAVW